MNTEHDNAAADQIPDAATVPDGPTPLDATVAPPAVPLPELLTEQIAMERADDGNGVLLRDRASGMVLGFVSVDTIFALSAHFLIR